MTAPASIATPQRPAAGLLAWWQAQPPRRLALGLFALLCLASTRSLVKEALLGWHLTDSWKLLYQAATVSVNYVQFGLVRRGLAGTFIYLTGLPQIAGTVVFHLVSAAGVAAVGVALLRRAWPQAGAAWQMAHAAVLLILMLFWAEDAGRTDLSVAALVGAGVLALQADRPVAAALALVAALGIHENGFIYGGPLLSAVLWRRWRAGGVQVRLLLPAALLLAAVGVGYAFFDRLPRLSNAEVTALVRGRMPDHILVDWAIYFGISGMRGVQASICQNLQVDPNYPLHVASGLLLIGLTLLTLGQRSGAGARQALWAALLPYLFLCAVANDLSRWTALACFNAWVMSVTLPRPDGRRPARALVHSLLAAGLLLVLVHPKWPLRAPIPIYTPSPFIDALVARAGGPVTPNVGVALERCDPRWREVLVDPTPHR